MATKNHRQGGKFGGDHTTFIDPAVILADIADKQPEVSRISAGFIKSGQGNGGSGWKVKISDCPGGVLLTVRQSGSGQEVRVFTRDSQSTKLALARGARNRDIAILFGKRGMAN